MDADANANTDAGGSTIALCELRSGKLKTIYPLAQMTGGYKYANNQSKKVVQNSPRLHHIASKFKKFLGKHSNLHNTLIQN